MTQNYSYVKLADSCSEHIRLRLLMKKQQAPLFDPGIPLSTQRTALDASGNKIVLAQDQHIEPVLAGGVAGEWINALPQADELLAVFPSSQLQYTRRADGEHA